jgi:hypothetical protein
MRPGLVEVEQIRMKHPMELLLMQNKQVIETLAPHTPQKTLTDGIRARGEIRSCENLDATRLRNPSEAHSKLAIVITDEVLWPQAIGGGDPSLLCDPSVGGTSCDAHPFSSSQQAVR